MIVDLIVNIGFSLMRLAFVLFPNKELIPDVFTGAWDWGMGLIANVLYLFPDSFQEGFLVLMVFSLSIMTAAFFYLLIRNIYQLVKIW